MENLPSGTVSFLFTDIEGSTKLAQEHPEAWEQAQEKQLHLVVRGMDQGQLVIGMGAAGIF